MIYVSEDQLEQVQYLLEQSTLGNHVLFDLDTIRRIAPTLGQEARTEFEKGLLMSAEKLLEELILCPSIDAKMDFLQCLDPEVRDEVARVYLRIVENAAAEDAVRH